MAYQKTRNMERLSFLYLLTGNTDNLRKMLKIAKHPVQNDTMARFHNALFLGDVAERVCVLEEAGQVRVVGAARPHKAARRPRPRRAPARRAEVDRRAASRRTAATQRTTQIHNKEKSLVRAAGGVVGRAALGGASCRRAATRTVTRERESDTPAARGFFTDLNTACVVTRVRPRPSFGGAWSRFVSFRFFRRPPARRSSRSRTSRRRRTGSMRTRRGSPRRRPQRGSSCRRCPTRRPRGCCSRRRRSCARTTGRCSRCPRCGSICLAMTFHHMRTSRLQTTRDGTVTAARLLPKLDLATTFSHQDHLVFGTAQM